MCSWVQKATHADLQDSKVPVSPRSAADSVIFTPVAKETDLYG